MPDTPEAAQQKLEEAYDIGADDVLPDEANPAGEAEGESASPPSNPDKPRDEQGRFTPKQAGEHPAWLVEEATDLGFTDEDMADMTPAALGRAVRKLNQVFRTEARDDRRFQERADRPNNSPSQPPSQQPNDLPDLDPQKWEPELVQILSGLKQRVKALEEQLVGMGQREAVRETRSQIEQLDSCFQKDQELFGKGSGDRLKKADPQKFQKRLALIAVMKSLDSGSVQERYEEAKQILYGDTPKEEAKPEVPKGMKERWQAGQLARPTQRVPGPDLPGVRKATKAVAAHLKEVNGAQVTGEDDTSKEDFL